MVGALLTNSFQKSDVDYALSTDAGEMTHCFHHRSSVIVEFQLVGRANSRRSACTHRLCSLSASLAYVEGKAAALRLGSGNGRLNAFDGSLASHERAMMPGIQALKSRMDRANSASPKGLFNRGRPSIGSAVPV